MPSSNKSMAPVGLRKERRTEVWLVPLLPSNYCLVAACSSVPSPGGLVKLQYCPKTTAERTVDLGAGLDRSCLFHEHLGCLGGKEGEGGN